MLWHARCNLLGQEVINDNNERRDRRFREGVQKMMNTAHGVKDSAFVVVMIGGMAGVAMAYMLILITALSA